MESVINRGIGDVKTKLAEIEQWKDGMEAVDANAEVIAARDGQDSLAYRLNLINDIAATQVPTFNDDGKIDRIEHKDLEGNILRTDAFTYDGDLITEVRTLAGGATVTYKYHLDTLETEVI